MLLCTTTRHGAAVRIYPRLPADNRHSSDAVYWRRGEGITYNMWEEQFNALLVHIHATTSSGYCFISLFIYYLIQKNKDPKVSNMWHITRRLAHRTEVIFSEIHSLHTKYNVTSRPTHKLYKKQQQNTSYVVTILKLRMLSSYAVWVAARDFRITC